MEITVNILKELIEDFRKDIHNLIVEEAYEYEIKSIEENIKIKFKSLPRRIVLSYKNNSTCFTIEKTYYFYSSPNKTIVGRLNCCNFFKKIKPEG